MSDTKRPQAETSSAAAQAGAMLGGRPLRLRAGRGEIALAEGLVLSWKAQDVPAGDGAVGARATEVDGLTALTLDLPPGLGWVRLNVDLAPGGPDPGPDPDVSPRLLACRILVSVPAEGPAQTLRPALSRINRKTGRVDLVPASEQALSLPPGGWHLIEALLLCPADDEAHDLGLILRLAEDARITLGPVETAWFAPEPPEPALAERLRQDGTVPLRPFSARAVPPEALPGVLAGPFAADVTRHGLDINGWVLAQPAARVTLAGGGEVQSLPATEPARIAPGLRLAAGFTASVLPFLGTDEPPGPVRVTLGRGQGGASLAELPLPPAYAALRQPRPAPPHAAAGRITLFHGPPDPGPDPYRSLLYRAMPQADARPGDLEMAIARLEAQATPVVLHLHALAPLLAEATGPADAQVIAAAYIDRLSYFVHLGGILLWTVEGPLPGQTDQDRVLHRLGQAVADRARLVHVHGAAAAARVQACWRIPAGRLLVATHPSYAGHYPAYVSQSGARARLGLTEPGPQGPEPVTGPVFLLQGQLSADKGIDDLVAAFAVLRRTVPEAWLLIAGDPLPPMRKGTLTRSYGALPHVRVIETRAAETTLQWYHRAADWAVLPYRDVITPKALLCAASFGLPAVAPALAAVAEHVTPGQTGLLYPAAGPSSRVADLAEALARAAATPATMAQAMGEAARAALDPNAATTLATHLVQAITQAWQADPVTLDFDDHPRQALLLGRPFPPPVPARTAVIILNYGHADDTRRLIQTLEAGTDTDFDVYVVDNCSPNLSLPDLATLFGDVHVLRLPENLGYAAGNNAALRLISDLPYDFVWVLNPDMVVPPAALAQHIEAAAAHPQTDIFGPVLLHGDNGRRIASAGCYLSLDDGLSVGHLYPGEQTSVLPAAPYAADFITGAALFLRRRVLRQIGLMPEDFFLYFEETAWLAAAKAKGHAAVVLPHIHLTHHKRSEDGDLPARHFLYYYIRNALILAARLGRDEAVPRTVARLRTTFIANWLTRIKASHPDQLASYQALAEQALADGEAGRTGPVDLQAAASPDAPVTPAPDAAVWDSLSLLPEAGNLLLGRLVHGPGPARVAVLFDGRPLGEVQARPAPSGDAPDAAGLQGFQIALPAGAWDGRAHRLSVRINGHAGGQPIPLFLPRPAPALSGALTGLKAHVCTGWLSDASAPDTPLEAEILQGERVLGRGLANLPGGPGEGAACGFAIRLPRALADGEAHQLTLRQVGSTRTIATATLADAAFDKAGRTALEAGPSRVLEDMAYVPELWFGAQDPASLPIGRQMQAASAALHRLHARPDQGALVSIILPVHNRAGLAAQAIASVLAQGYRLWELIVIDDASTDDTATTLQALLSETRDSRIRLIRRETNGGAAAARNSGLAQARGELIAYLDSDDLWHPAYLETMVGALMASPGDHAVACGHWIAQGAAPGDTAGATEIIGLRLPPQSLAQIDNRDLLALSGYVHRAGPHTGGSRTGGPLFDPALRRHAGWGLILDHLAQGMPLPLAAPLVTCRIDTPDRLEMTEPAGPALARLETRTARPTPAPGALRPVDVVLRAPEAEYAEALRRRIAALALTLRPEAGHRIIVQVGSAMVTPLAGLVSGELRLQPAQDSLAGALSLRRDAADLVVIEPDALVQAGWIEALTRALVRVPQAGMLVPRHSLPGRSGAARRHAPAADPARDTCITVSAVLRNLAGPMLDRAEGLLPLTGFAPFCTYIPAAVARVLPPPTAPDHATQMAEWADLVRLHLGRPLLYCPRALAFEMPL